MIKVSMMFYFLFHFIQCLDYYYEEIAKYKSVNSFEYNWNQEYLTSMNLT